MSELSGKPLDGMAEVHHKDRVADKPERAFDPTNLAVIRKDEHSEYHNSDYPQNEKDTNNLKKYKNKVYVLELWDSKCTPLTQSIVKRFKNRSSLHPLN